MQNEIMLPCLLGVTLYAGNGNIVAVTKKKKETFPISSIQSFLIEEPRGMRNGSIFITTAQAATLATAIIGTEKRYVFTKEHLESAREISDYFSTCKNEIARQSAHISEKAVVSVADELRGLKELLDEGVISQEEFNSQKMRLLNL